MKAAIVSEAGIVPVYADHPEPAPGPDERLLTVAASALSPLTRGRASGTHYSVTGAGFPFVPGVDGVGRADNGARLWFVLPRPPHGAMAERVPVPAAHCVPLPDALDDVAAAALGNPGMSSWAALTERANLRDGETVLVNGATGNSGRLAVAIARHLGAARIIATGRNRDALAASGADRTIPLGGGDEAALAAVARDAFADGVDVVLDYLWGGSAAALLGAASTAASRPLRFVQIGGSSGPTLPLPGAVLRAAPITLLGSGLGSVPLPRLLAGIVDMFRAAPVAGFAVPARVVPLTDVERAWAEAEQHRARTVFVTDAA